jgi:predicted  nucleic acid-binding Zn-ribbon protein
MSERDLGEELDKLDENIETLKNTKFKIFGISVTPITLGAAFTVVSTVIGGLYGAFTVYNDYMEMKEQIQSYVAPDLSAFQEQISVMTEKMNSVEDSVVQTTDYARDIRNNLKTDIRKLEEVVDDTARRVKDTQDNIDNRLREIERLNRETEKDIRDTMRDTETRIQEDVRKTNQELRDTIQKALDNPLAN